MPRILLIGSGKINLDDVVPVMGVLNLTPDSFYDGGKYSSVEEAVRAAVRMEEEGALIIDVGGESTKPGSERISEEAELERIIPVLKEIRKRVKIPISVDTCKSKVAEQAIGNGADMINDVSGFSLDDDMALTVSKAGCPVVIGHMKGTPESMQEDVFYEEVVAEVIKSLEDKIKLAVKSGIRKSSIIIDPGIGFGKRLEDNLHLLKRLSEFKKFDLPVLIGASRKSFIGAILNLEPDERQEGSIAAACAAVMNGADIIRAHDVKETVRAVKVVKSIINS